MNIQIITCGKVVATYTEFADAFRHARELSMQNREIPVYVQDSLNLSIFRNGYVIN